MMLFTSPLTGTHHVKHLYNITSDDLCYRWQQSYGINIEAEIAGCTEITCYECCQSRLRFFTPTTVSGSSAFYAALQQFPWYYMPHKWEHQVAMEDIRQGDQVLEVGCGFGDFVKHLLDNRTDNVNGIELNRKAVSIAQGKGLPVTSTSLEEFARQEPGKYDVVCHFEVLEHVENPLEFLQTCIACLKPGGKLLIAVPNMDSFIRYSDNNLLNQPPHHMTQWFPYTFQVLPKYLPLKLERLVFEPLANYHSNWYIGTQVKRLPEIRYLTRLTRLLGRIAGKPLLRIPQLRKAIRGHTQYVAFSRL